jgi:hypothetical protein
MFADTPVNAGRRHTEKTSIYEPTVTVRRSGGVRIDAFEEMT